MPFLPFATKLAFANGFELGLSFLRGPGLNRTDRDPPSTPVSGSVCAEEKQVNISRSDRVP